MDVGKGIGDVFGGLYELEIRELRRPELRFFGFVVW